MGLRYRKSINLGGGLRINLSKSGVGYSWGFPGFRTSKSPNGTKQKTFYIPGTGISYVKRSSKKKKIKEKPDIIPGTTDRYEVYSSKQIENDVLIDMIERNKRLNTFSNLLILTTPLILINYLFVIIPSIGLLIKVLLMTIWKINLIYEFDGFTEKKYMSLKKALNTLSESKKIWQINSSTMIQNYKKNAGATTYFSKSICKISKNTPFYIKHNIELNVLRLKKGKLLFTPDKLIYFKGNRVYGTDFKNIKITVRERKFIEAENIPSDTQIIDHTWKYTNKDGGKDNRYSNNTRYPVCEYGEILFESNKGLNTYLNFSKTSSIHDIKNYFEEFEKYSYHNSEKIQKEKLPLYEEAKLFLSKQEKYLYKFDLMEELKINEEEINKIIDRLIEDNYIKDDKDRFMFEIIK